MIQKLKVQLETLGKESTALWGLFWRALKGLKDLRKDSFLSALYEGSLSAWPLVLISGFFMGLVLALSASRELLQFGSLHLVPDLVAISLVTELGPLFTAFLMAGKTGAGLASELGLLNYGGEIQAMRALSLDPDKELLVPKFWAALLGILLLTIAAILMGLLGGMALGHFQLGLSPILYLNRSIHALAPLHLVMALTKGLGFAVIVALFGLRFGLSPKPDAPTLGRHTMRAVVYGSFSVLIADHLIGAFLHAWWAL